MNLEIVKNHHQEPRVNSIKQISLFTFQLIVGGSVTSEGSEVIIRQAAAHNHFEDVELAFDEMALNGHNHAEFGINRRFMYSKMDPKLTVRKFELIQ